MICIQYERQFYILGQKIAFYRKLKHLSQVQLAERVGISASYLSKIERADLESMSLGTLMQLTEALEVSLYQFFKD